MIKEHIKQYLEPFSKKDNIKLFFIPCYSFYKCKKEKKYTGNNGNIPNTLIKKYLNRGIVNTVIVALVAAIIIGIVYSVWYSIKRKAFDEKYFPSKSVVELTEEYSLTENYNIMLPSEKYKSYKDSNTILLETSAGYISITTSQKLKSKSIEEQDEELTEILCDDIRDDFNVKIVKSKNESVSSILNNAVYQKNGFMDIKGKGICYCISYFIQIDDTSACQIIGFVESPFSATGKKDDIASTVDSIAKSLNLSSESVTEKGSFSK